MNVSLLCDGYKIDHRRQYPDNTQLVFSNLTPRASRREGQNFIIYFGGQFFVKRWLIEEWNKNFFQQPKEQVLAKYARRINNYLGEGAVTYEHIAALHDLGYLPLIIQSVPEGTKVPLKVPCLIMYNTLPDFFWLTNYFETLLSCEIWGMCTSATTAYQYRQILNKYADLTVGNRDFVQWQGHDFSFRGMFGVEAARMSGAAHLLSFTGTDTLPAIDFLEEYYGADSDKELIGGSVAATEHSVMAMGGMEDEVGTFKRLITEIYPKGIVSVVSDTWDFWKVLTEYLVELKGIVMARDGKLVIRPDSGDPVKIICGDPDADSRSPEYRGAVQCLWDIFGGTITDKGYKQLDSHIGLIYGDSITLERAEIICDHLERSGFASTNVVLGIGSYTYQYVTRDTFGFAVKATYGIVNDEPRQIFKSPKTDSGEKKSAKGLLAVYNNETNGDLELRDCAEWANVNHCLWQTIFKDGELFNETTLSEIRNRLL